MYNGLDLSRTNSSRLTLGMFIDMDYLFRPPDRPTARPRDDSCRNQLILLGDGQLFGADKASLPISR